MTARCTQSSRYPVKGRDWGRLELQVMLMAGQHWAPEIGQPTSPSDSLCGSDGDGTGQRGRLPGVGTILPESEVTGSSSAHRPKAAREQRPQASTLV